MGVITRNFLIFLPGYTGIKARKLLYQGEKPRLSNFKGKYEKIG